MTWNPSLDEILPALETGIEHLILVLDYAMWLHTAYEGSADDAPISLVRRPRQDRLAAIEAHLSDHRSEFADEDLESDQDRLRGKVWDRVIWEVAGAQARYVVPTWLMQELEGGRPAVLTDFELPKTLVLSRLIELVRTIKRDEVGSCWEHLHLDAAWDLLPVGTSLQNQHRDYLDKRQKLIAGYNWLTGIARQHREFMDNYESHLGIRVFPPALAIAGTVESTSSQDPIDEVVNTMDASTNGQQRSAITEKLIKGVSLQDAAERIRSGDPRGQAAMVKGWRNSRDPKLPVPIGKSPGHAQRNLYEPAALMAFLRKIEGKEVDSDFDLNAHFQQVSREPRP